MRNVILVIVVVLLAGVLVTLGGGIYAITTVAREAIATWGDSQDVNTTQQGKTDRTGKWTDLIGKLGESLFNTGKMLAL